MKQEKQSQLIILQLSICQGVSRASLGLEHSLLGLSTLTPQASNNAREDTNQGGLIRACPSCAPPAQVLHLVSSTHSSIQQILIELPSSMQLLP